MKARIFVFSRENMIIYSLILFFAIGLIAYNFNGSSVASSVAKNKQLPIYSVETQEKKLALTFDVAWGDQDITAILDILDKYNVKATFFTVGEWLSRCEDAAKNIVARGHELGNHSDNHPYPTKLSKEEFLADAAACDKKINKLTGKNPVIYRAPYGDYNDAVVRAAKEAGYYFIQWDVDSLDWKGLPKEKIHERVVTKVKNGSIILMHNDTKHTVEALPEVLEKLAQDGYSFVKTSDLIYKDNYEILHDGTQKKK